MLEAVTPWPSHSNLAAVFHCLTGLLKLSHKTTELLLPCVWAALLSLPPEALKQVLLRLCSVCVCDNCVPSPDQISFSI